MCQEIQWCIKYSKANKFHLSQVLSGFEPHALFVLSNVCLSVRTHESSFPLADQFQPSPHPGPFSLSAGNVILGKPDSHYFASSLPASKSFHRGSPTCSPWLSAAYTVDDLHSSTLAIAWGDITILMLHSTPGANECHKKKTSLDSIFLKPHPYPPLTFFFLLFRICYLFLIFFFGPIHSSHSFTQSGLKCVRGWQALRSWIKKAIWWRGKQRWLHRRREEKWEAWFFFEVNV